MTGGPGRPTSAAPAVSFLCSAYRTAGYLPATITSVLAQTRPDWELVVVDNGMDDAIRDVVAAHDDPRIVLRRQENAGVEGGVAAAAAAATGRYVAVLHSDDQVAPEYVARLAGLLDAHPGVDAVGCDAVVIDDATGATRNASWFDYVGAPRHPRFTHPLALHEVIERATIYYSSLVRRQAWDAAGGYRTGHGIADAALWFAMLRAGADIRVVPDRLGRYRWRSDSLSRDADSLAHYQSIQVQAYLEAGAMSLDPRVHEAVARRLRRLGYHESLARARTALLAGDVPTARAEADAALRGHVRPRSLAVAAVVHVAPRVVARAWPLKQRLERRVRRLAQTRRSSGS
jgi:glycosyltransferase involved in cell wall biosynthesis